MTGTRQLAQKRRLLPFSFYISESQLSCHLLAATICGFLRKETIMQFEIKKEAIKDKNALIYRHALIFKTSYLRSCRFLRLCIIFGKCSVRISVGTPAVLSEVLRGFVISLFTSRPTPLLASIRASIFFFMIFVILKQIYFVSYTRS